MAGTIAAGNYMGHFISIRQAVPCILHLENRCGEKFIKMLLLEGFHMAGTNAANKKFLKKFKNSVNT
jgi:hypothetical protein